jgi:hypothetical protein
MAVIRNPVPARLRGGGMVRMPGKPGRRVTQVKGTAPSSTPDLEEVVRLIQEGLPEARWVQAPVTHPTDDDGVWFFWIPGLPGEVQIESSYAVVPFIVETDKHDECITASSPRETADTVIRWLKLPGGREESPWHSR